MNSEKGKQKWKLKTYLEKFWLNNLQTRYMYKIRNYELCKSKRLSVEKQMNNLRKKNRNSIQKRKSNWKTDSRKNNPFSLQLMTILHRKRNANRYMITK